VQNVYVWLLTLELEQRRFMAWQCYEAALPSLCLLLMLAHLIERPDEAFGELVPYMLPLYFAQATRTWQYGTDN
jgi:hypothetical protein